MTTRCKFICESVTRRAEPSGWLYTARFHAVPGGSPENDSFFKYTPSATLDLGVYRDDIFIPGASYYIDITSVTLADA